MPRLLLNKHLEMGASLKALLEKIHPIATADYPLPTTRPQNSRLDCSLLENVFQLKLPPWQNVVKKYIKLILN
jgi:dTDP-4-dehydrorhamnose reductase